ncbi:MAG: hypothetical protein ACREI8_15940 [Myxococcota bacterium]
MRPLPVILGVPFGLVVGCAGGFVESLVETEEHADVLAAKSIVRERFRLEYPGNWTIDEADDDYDPDHLFSIDSPGSCHVTVIVFDAATSAKTSVEAQVNAFVPKLVKDPAKTPFATWGAYHGEGMTLAGKILGLQRGTIRIFAHENTPEDLTLTIVEFCFDEDIASVKPGFELIERTFKIGRQAS